MTTLKIEPLTPTIGAEISGVELNGALDRATLDAVYDALIEHLVIFFRDQDVTPQAQLRFAESFGDLDRPHHIYPHVEGYDRVVLLKNGPDAPPDTNEWHTDLTFHAEPPFASILSAQEVPPCGGDTLWASMYAAYDSLPEAMKQMLEGLEAVHDMGDFRNDYYRDGGVEGLNAALTRTGSAVHPVVRRHPVTGRRFLYVNAPFTRQILGLPGDASDRLLHYLYDHMNQPEYQMRFRWRAGSLAMWDNRVTQHYAVADYFPHHRTMHRVTVVKDWRAEGKEGLREAG